MVILLYEDFLNKVHPMYNFNTSHLDASYPTVVDMNQRLCWDFDHITNGIKFNMENIFKK